MTGFRITGGKGLHVTFDNGWTISVQIGPGNYCDNYNVGFSEFAETPAGKIRLESTCAEIAAWGEDGEMIDLSGDTVEPRVSPARVLELMNDISKREPTGPRKTVKHAVEAYVKRELEA